MINGIILLTFCCFSFISLVESQSLVVTQVTEPGVALAEGPFWDDLSQRLYYVDIDGKSLYRLDPDTKEEQVLHLDKTPSFVIPVKNQEFQFILALDRDLVLLTWDYRTDVYTTSTLVTVDQSHPQNRFNEAKADALGRVWAGTKGEEDENNLSPPDKAALYCIDTTVTGPVHADAVLTPVSISNGLVWSLDNRLLYYIDTPTRNVDVFCFNLKKGSISKRRTVFKFDENELEGVPDGLNIDSEGNLYVAVNGGGQVIKFNPSTGKILQKINIPVSRVTSIEFGGPNCEILYVTTMKSKTVGVPSEPLAGVIFAITGLNVTGLPSNRAIFNSCCDPDQK